MGSDVKTAAERLQQLNRGEDVHDVYPDLCMRNIGPSPMGDRASVVEFVLSHPYGELKPLEWAASVRMFSFRAESVFGQYGVNEKWGWLRCEVPVEFQCESIDHGKQLCQSDYERQVAALFKPIGGIQ